MASISLLISYTRRGNAPKADLGPAGGHAENPSKVRSVDALVVARHYFEERPRGRGSGSHYSFKTPWPGNPRVNLQDAGNGRAKAYQINQLLDAIGQLDGGGDA